VCEPGRERARDSFNEFRWLNDQGNPETTGTPLSSGHVLLAHLISQVYDTHFLVGPVRADGDPGKPKGGLEETLSVVPTSNPIVHDELDDY